MNNAVPMLRATDLQKTYKKYAEKVRVLRGVSIDVNAGDFVCIIGRSGSGKSTLMHLLGLLDSPDHGRIYLEDRRIDNVSREERDLLRNQTFGFIFQFYHLLPELNTLENVLMPAMIRYGFWEWWKPRRQLRQRAMQWLDRVGLSHRLRHRPRELSGGEMQRAAIARALINQPRILLADEPTGNLDAQNGAHVMNLLRDLNRQEGVTIVMVTHNLELVAKTDRVIRLADGVIETEASCATNIPDLQIAGQDRHAPW